MCAGDIMEEEFSHIINGKEIYFKYACGKSAANGKEIHAYNEIIYFLSGKATFVSDDIRIDLKPKTLIAVPSACFHQMILLNDAKDYKRCIFNFSGVKEIESLIEKKMDKVYICKITAEIEMLFQKAAEISKSKPENSDIILKSVLALLLDGLQILNEENYMCNPLTVNAIEYINRHLSEAITVADIARGLNFSPSQLSHTFKKDMQISIYKYVLQRRLAAAYTKIQSGVPAFLAAEECGFNDYSGFYRMYKKYLGFAPSKIQKSVK